ncbi:MAG TPA: hypothetical protein PKE65_09940, partial [Rhizobiaceae bacterium]|nr:hypothetical protein [Rhizobiaceae bacterium]
SVISLTPKQKEPIAYNPRPELVKPGDTSALPPPQENVASVDGAWPESPEERRARIRSEADERNASGAISTGPSAVRPVRDNTKYDDPFYQGKSESPVVAARRAKENRTRRTESTVDLASAPSKRRYLSDPPVEYRKPVETASAGELGEDEAEKERKRIAAAKGKSTKSWKDWLPWN